jgi:ankyrin repeat protein
MSVPVEKTTRAIDEWVNSSDDINGKYPNDDWSSLQMICSLQEGGADAVQSLILRGADVNIKSNGHSIPSITPLHIAVRRERLDLVEILLRARADINVQDQYGFTPLHYAIATRNKEIISNLVSRGALASIPSKNGSTALDVARSLKYTDVEDILLSKISSEKDPSMPKFREWLCHIGAGEYANGFIAAGYDLPFVAKHGLIESDLDCVGIPMSKLGLRRKLCALHSLKKFYTVEEEEEGEEEEGSDEEGSDEEEEESEEDED